MPAKVYYELSRRFGDFTGRCWGRGVHLPLLALARAEGAIFHDKAKRDKMR
jgi:hypothetical protein